MSAGWAPHDASPGATDGSREAIESGSLMPGPAARRLHTFEEMKRPSSVLLALALGVAGCTPSDACLTDADGDSFTVCGADGLHGTSDDDCDDDNPAVNSFADEICDGLDTNCDGDLPTAESDQDGDGLLACEECDDGDASVYPGALDLCDGIDVDCNPEFPPGERDSDADGVSECGGDCDDEDPTVSPEIEDTCDGRDTDCDPFFPPGDRDEDADGVPLCAGDCDDADATIAPGNADSCDGVDTDCDSLVPPGDVDEDGDGFPQCAGDCNDLDARAFPGAAEYCDGDDSDCDGVGEVDADGDGRLACSDCDDTDTNDSCSSLLSWAQAHLAASTTTGVLDGLTATMTPALGNPCATTTTVDLLELPAYAWDPGVTFAPGTLTSVQASSNETQTSCWTGTAEQGTGNTIGGWGVTGYNIDWLEASAFFMPSVLQLDGYTWTVGYWEDWPDGDWASLHHGTAADFTRLQASPGAFGATGAWQTTSSFVRDSAPVPVTFQRVVEAGLTAEIEWDPTLGESRGLLAGLEWEAGLERTDWSGAVLEEAWGCLFEPSSGQFVVEEADGANEVMTVEVQFPGSTECDGCGALTVNGVPTGEWCVVNGPTSGWFP